MASKPDIHQSVNAEQWINRCWRRVRIGQFLKNAADMFAAFLFCFGAAVLIVKLSLPSYWPHVLWIATIAIPLAVVAWFVSGRDRFSRTECVAILDLRMNAGGLLMTLSEAPDEQWHEQLPQYESIWKESLPQLWPMRFFRSVLFPVVFLVGVFYVPIREIHAETIRRSPNSTAHEATAQLQEFLDKLDDHAVIDEDEKKQLSDEIEKLIKETENSPLTHEKWEIVDALKDRMRMRVDSSAASVGKARDALGQLAKLTQIDGSELLPEAVEQLRKDVAEGLKKIAKAGGFQKLSPELRDQLEKLLKDQDFEIPDGLLNEQAMKELQEFLQNEAQRLEELRQQQGQGNGQGQLRGRRGGVGGIAEGPGHEKIDYGDDSTLDGTKFKETVLPPGSLDDPSNQVVGVTLSAPNDKPVGKAPRGQARRSTAASGDEARSRNIRPRHRSVIRRYFDREDKDTD